MAETVQIKNIKQAAILEKVDELRVVAAIVEGCEDRLTFPSLVDDGSIWMALIAILEGEETALEDVGKLLHYIANVLDDLDSYR